MDTLKVGSVKGKVLVDDTVYDPPGVWADLLQVILLPLVHQGPHDGLAEGAAPA